MGITFNITKNQLLILEALVAEGFELASEMEKSIGTNATLETIKNDLGAIREGIDEYNGEDGIIDIKDYDKSEKGTNLAISLITFPDIFFPFPDGDRGKYHEYHERCRKFNEQVFSQVREEV